MKSVSDIIDGLGGSAAVARELGLKASTVSEMKRRRSIPVKYWPGFMRLAHEKQAGALNGDMLISIHVDADREVAA